MEVVMVPDSDREQILAYLVEQYQLELLRMCYLYLRDAMLAEDALQETFIKAYRSLESFRGECTEKTWLTRIAINTCKDMQCSAWMRHVDKRVTPDMLPVASVAFEEKDEELIMAVMQLPVKLRETVLLHYYQDMSVKEIAQSLSLTSSTVSNRLKRASKKLRMVLERGHYHG